MWRTTRGGERMWRTTRGGERKRRTMRGGERKRSGGGGKAARYGSANQQSGHNEVDKNKNKQKKHVRILHGEKRKKEQVELVAYKFNRK